MPLEVYGVKRKAQPGEIGLFIDSPVFAEDFAKIKLGTEVRLEITTERNAQMFKFLWALAGKIAENSESFLDREDAMDNVPYGLKCKAGHAKAVVDPETGKVTVRPLSLKRLDGEAFKRLLDRMVYVACRDIVPGMEPGPLTDEIEAMLTRRERK
jgi:hypothetical protein